MIIFVIEAPQKVCLEMSRTSLFLCLLACHKMNFIVQKMSLRFRRIWYVEVNIFVPDVQGSIDVFDFVGPIFETFGSIIGLESIFQNLRWTVAAHVRTKLVQAMLIKLLHVTQKLDGNLNQCKMPIY